jgi:hypothetical protein
VEPEPVWGRCLGFLDQTLAFGATREDADGTGEHRPWEGRTMRIDPQPEFGHDPETYGRAVPQHAYLIEMARELPSIANKGDHARLSVAASSLLEAFVRHAEEERALVLRLPPITARLVENGQQRVVDRLVSLVLEADLAGEPCSCAVLADEVASLIDVQIMSEEWDQTDR